MGQSVPGGNLINYKHKKIEIFVIIYLRIWGNAHNRMYFVYVYTGWSVNTDDLSF